jgi:GDP-4-dehydro-6-deoxy-D-mannose reductase
MTILVTGAGGFIGRNLVQHLKAAHPQAEIAAIDIETLDVRDRAACFELFQRVKPTHFVHAAALTIADDDEAVRAVNFYGTVNVLDAAMSAGSIKRGVILSSSGVYGAPDGIACDEHHPLYPVGAYACAKRDAESLLDGRLLVVAARIGPVYGPFEEPSVSRPKTSVIQQLVQALTDARVLRIGGTDMHRDWTHAADVAAALDGLLFAEKLNHSIYNVSAGESISARAVITAFVERGLKVCWTSDLTQADIVLDEKDSRGPLVIERLRRDTGFAPRHSIYD